MKPVKLFRVVVEDSITYSTDRMEFHTMHYNPSVVCKEDSMLYDNTSYTVKYSPVRQFSKFIAKGNGFDIPDYIESTYVVLDPVLEEYTSLLIDENVRDAKRVLVEQYEGEIKALQKENQSLHFEKEMLVEDKWAQRQLDLKVSDLQCQYIGWGILGTVLWLLGLWFI